MGQAHYLQMSERSGLVPLIEEYDHVEPQCQMFSKDVKTQPKDAVYVVCTRWIIKKIHVVAAGFPIDFPLKRREFKCLMSPVWVQR